MERMNLNVKGSSRGLSAVCSCFQSKLCMEKVDDVGFKNKHLASKLAVPCLILFEDFIPQGLPGQVRDARFVSAQLPLGNQPA